MELATTYEQAGIVYMGMGRWEEAQANFESADRHIPEDIDHPDTPQDIVNKKLRTHDQYRRIDGQTWQSQLG